MPRVSVLIATRDRTWCLPRAVESVLAQTFQDFEVLVIDAGSSDDVHDLLSGCGPKVRYSREENKGPSAARNRGIELARGEYVTFLDDDDYLLEDALRLGVEALDDHPEVGYAYGQAYCVNEGGQIEGTKQSALFGVSQVVCGKELIREMLVTYRIPMNGFMVRRRCFERLGGFNEEFKFGGDLDMNVRLAKEYSAFYIAAPLSCILSHPFRLSQIPAAANAEGLYLQVLKEVFEDPVLSEHFKRLRNRAHCHYYRCIAGRAYGDDMAMTRRYISKAIRICPVCTIGPDGAESAYMYFKTLLPTAVRRSARKLKLRLLGIASHLAHTSSARPRASRVI